MNTMNRAQFILNNIEECALCVHPFLGGGGKMLVVNTHTHTCPFRPSSSLNGEHPVSHEAGNSHTLLMLDLNFFLLVSQKKKHLTS